jgi:hypothetical protein
VIRWIQLRKEALLLATWFYLVTVGSRVCCPVSSSGINTSRLGLSLGNLPCVTIHGQSQRLLSRSNREPGVSLLTLASFLVALPMRLSILPPIFSPIEGLWSAPAGTPAPVVVDD